MVTGCADFRSRELWSLIFGEPGASEAAHCTSRSARGDRAVSKRGSCQDALTLRLPLGARGRRRRLLLDRFRQARVRLVIYHPELLLVARWHLRGACSCILAIHPECTLAELWMPGQSRDEVCDLTKPGDLEHLRDLPELPEGVAQAIFDPHQSVLHLMEAAAFAFGAGEGVGGARMRR